MTSRDIFQSLPQQDAATIEMVVARMEARARDPRFVQMRARYFDALELASARTVLDLGCGTGLDARAAAARPEFKGVATGIDLSEAMIEAGLRFAKEEGIADRIFLRAGDAERTGLPDGSFDVVVMHTLVSHVVDPMAVLREAARLLSPAGRLCIFDADFASLSFGYPDAAVARAMEESILAAMVANPRIMRAMPRLLQDCGLAVQETQPNILSDAGSSTFFSGFIENFAPLVKRFEFLPGEVVDAWMEEQRRALEQGYFFGSLNYHAYIVKKER